MDAPIPANSKAEIEKESFIEIKLFCFFLNKGVKMDKTAKDYPKA